MPFYSTMSIRSVKILAFHEAPKFDMLHTTPSTDEDEHVDLNHICGVLDRTFGIFRNGSVVDSAGCNCTSAQAVIEF